MVEHSPRRAACSKRAGAAVTTLGPLVSIALPVFNGADSVESVIESVLAQTHTRLELLISDNASTDKTQEICTAYARRDPRIRYHRHATNVGIVKNFVGVAQRARGEYLRWIGDDDWLEPEYLSRALRVFAEDERRVVVTTQMVYVGADGTRTLDTSYDPAPLSSEDPVERLGELLRLLTSDFARLDPLYGLIRRDLAALPRRNMLREDQIFAGLLALAGPWGHVAEPLARRNRHEASASAMATLLGVPRWQRHVRVLLHCRELSRLVNSSPLDRGQRLRAHAEIVRFYARGKRSATRRRALGADQVVRRAARLAVGRTT